MFKSFKKSELAIITLALEEDETWRSQHARKEKMWIHKIKNH
jgi:hypothetical protein